MGTKVATSALTAYAEYVEEAEESAADAAREEEDIAFQVRCTELYERLPFDDPEYGSCLGGSFYEDVDELFDDDHDQYPYDDHLDVDDWFTVHDRDSGLLFGLDRHV